MGKLIWLASYPKSGNTWLRAFLHNYLLRSERPHPIDRMMAVTTGETGAGLYARHDPRPASHYTAAEVQRMRPLVHADLTRISPGPVFVKTHNASLTLHGIPLVTPAVTQGAIYLVRDPRDVAVSFSRHLGLSIDDTIAFMADPDVALAGNDKAVFERLSSWSVHVHFWTRRPDPRLLAIRYEDLLANPHEAFGRVVAWLGGPAEPRRLDRAIAFSSFETLRAQEKAGGFVEGSLHNAEFFRQGRAGNWQTALSPRQADRIQAAHAVQMARFGYR